MIYLAIDNKEAHKLSYAVFRDKSLIDYGELSLEYKVFTSDILLEIYDKVKYLIEQYKIDIVLTQLLNSKLAIKEEYEKLVEMRTCIKLCALHNKSLFSEFKTDGWEQRILYKRVTNSNKLQIINTGYRIELLKTQIGIANAIILGEGVAHNRLQIGKE